MSNNYGWCQSCGALVFNSPQCHKCDGKVEPFCVDITLVKQAKRIKDLEKAVEEWRNKADSELDINAGLHTENALLQKRIEELEALRDTVSISCHPPDDCNDPKVLKTYMKGCYKAASKLY